MDRLFAEREGVEKSAGGSLSPALRGAGAIAGAGAIPIVGLKCDGATGIVGRRATRVEADKDVASALVEQLVLRNREGPGRDWSGIGPELCDADDAAVDHDAETGAQGAFHVAHHLLGVQVVTGENVDFHDAAIVVGHNACGNHAFQRGEQPLNAVRLGRRRRSQFSLHGKECGCVIAKINKSAAGSPATRASCLVAAG